MTTVLVHAHDPTAATLTTALFATSQATARGAAPGGPNLSASLGDVASGPAARRRPDAGRGRRAAEREHARGPARVSLATASQIVTDLEALELVERFEDPTDRRRTLVKIAEGHRDLTDASSIPGSGRSSGRSTG